MSINEITIYLSNKPPAYGRIIFMFQNNAKKSISCLINTLLTCFDYFLSLHRMIFASGAYALFS